MSHSFHQSLKKVYAKPLILTSDCPSLLQRKVKNYYTKMLLWEKYSLCLTEYVRKRKIQLLTLLPKFCKSEHEGC